MSSGAQNMKTRADAAVPLKTSLGAQNMKTETYATPPKTLMGTQNMKMGPDTLGTAENESGRAKLENGSRRPRYRRKRLRKRKT
jgi:hypothetical protein